MRDEVNYYRFYDSSIGVGGPGNDWRTTFHRCMNLLRRIGFSVGPDLRIERNYKSLTKSHRAGDWKGCQLVASYYPAGFEIEFFQNIVHENPHGGQYDFDKLSKMPYLIRLRFLHARKLLAAFLSSLGFSDHSDPDLDRIEFIKEQIRKSGHFRGGDPLVDWFPREDYNAKDRDGSLIRPGDRKCFYHYTGHLFMGTAYYNLNNMWWLLCGSKVCNVAGFELFDHHLDLPRRRTLSPKKQQQKLKNKLDAAVEKMDFERAIVLRDLIQHNQPEEPCPK